MPLEDTRDKLLPPTESSAAAINRVSVKVPPFWKENASIWFTQLESQFLNSGITSDITKYHTVVGNIETEILSQVSDIIISPPSVNAYETLKNRLIDVYSDSEERKLKRLLQDLDLGDKRPSILLRQMSDLAGNRVGAEFLKSLWLQRLPSQMQAILATSEETPQKLAIMADKIADITGPVSISATEVEPKVDEIQSINARISVIERQISDLCIKTDKLFKLHSRGRSFSRNRNRNSRSRSPNQERVCWYHSKFGNEATKCTKPCSFAKEN